MKSYRLSLRASRSASASAGTLIGRLYRRSAGSSHQPSLEVIRCTGNDVVGRGCLSARHQSCLRRKLPRGVPPSPSRLLALMPPRPSATGNASIPAMSQPRLESPALRRTVMRDKDRLGTVTDYWPKWQFLLALLAMNVLFRECDKRCVCVLERPWDDGQ